MFAFEADIKDYVAVIDIGSNSVRLVVFSGEKRVPDTIFNEKVMVGLGGEVGSTGRMGKNAVLHALSTLKRFKALCEQMSIRTIHTVATAAVRDAENGEEFVVQVREECGLQIEIIDGNEEARLAALGVLSGDPDAYGITGDLGGGSLELAQVKNGKVGETISLPIGPLRLISMFGYKRNKIRKYLRETFANINWLDERSKQNLYIVGGAWRNIARMMMMEKAEPLPILHGYYAKRKECKAYCKRISKLNPRDIPFGNVIPTRRREILPIAAIILVELMEAMQAKNVVSTSYGLREGLIFDHLNAERRQDDPFLFVCNAIAMERNRFAEHSDVIYEWTRPLFSGKAQKKIARERLHKAICLLSDIAWRGHPDFRAEKAVEAVLHGNFVGVGHKERTYIAVALNQAYGASVDEIHISRMLPLLTISEIQEARLMGSALRLAQRLSGGAVKALEVSSLKVSKSKLKLDVPASYRDIANDIVERRLRQLAQFIGRKPEIEYV